MEKIIIDWHNHCRIVCQNANIAHFSSRKLADGRKERVLGEKPGVVVQIDESLLRAKRQANRGRILAGNENISIEDRIEWRNMYRGIKEEQSLNRNNGMRIEGPWVFGVIECTLQNDGSYKSGETRL
ncbi:hypothetical protein RF11_13888 [Thelohanellus kitauei]|uniref:ISXO2-like transposase domain-containing protein n=1 Tax=Thelohanellus kitauei TaxID=669202 RepID=A0A0C2MGV9_THEKT|nr:hypothetical protein RF11_13888 [Thelohanellus kitauei]